jgi:hypothetical protein
MQQLTILPGSIVEFPAVQSRGLTKPERAALVPPTALIDPLFASDLVGRTYWSQQGGCGAGQQTGTDLLGGAVP